MLNTNHLSFIYSFLLSLAFLLLMHTARHTFATTVTLTEGVPLESISKMLGHTNTVTTQIYAKIVNEKLRKDASEWNKKMVGIEDEFNLKNQ